MDDPQDIAMESNVWLCLPERCERATSIPMEATIWQELPQDLLLMILARLSMRDLAKMRSVSKEWNYLLSSSQDLHGIASKLAVYSIPGFLVQMKWSAGCTAAWVIEYLAGNSLDMNIYRAPLPDNLVIADACKSICCCHTRASKMELLIGNPARRAWRQLPAPGHLRKWDFIAMDFDVSRRRCALLLGDNNIEPQRREENTIVMEIYDSESNAWNRVSMTVPRFIYPKGKGICSNGKCYWVSYRDRTGFVVAFIIAEKRWTEIRLPDYCNASRGIKHVELGGSDGHILLIVDFIKDKRLYMWSLKEEQSTMEWSERHEIRRPDRNVVYVRRTQGRNVISFGIITNRRPLDSPVGANNTGWTMTFDSDNLEMSICHPEQRLIRRITLPGLTTLQNDFPSRPKIFVSAFESNNVWWPWVSQLGICRFLS